MKKTSIVIISLVIALASIKGAQASVIDSAVKTLDSSLTQLITAKDGSPTSQLSPVEDLAFRKKVVNDALELSLKEIREIRGKIDSLKFDDESRENSVKGGLLSRLAELEGYYRNLQGKLDKEEDVERVKDMAREAKAYREETHEPVIKEAFDFILALQTDKLVTSADARHRKIDSDLKKLGKAGLIESGYFNNQMDKAKDLISGARKLADEARYLVINPTDSDDSDHEETATDKEKEPKPTPREISESALSDLKSAYNIFVDISTSVKKILKI